MARHLLCMLPILVVISECLIVKALTQGEDSGASFGNEFTCEGLVGMWYMSYMGG